MRIICTIYLAAALLVGFTACEMNEELKKNTGTSSEMGRLALDLSVKSTTKAADDVLSFPVVIINKETGETAKSFDSYADLLDHSPVELPVGTYMVKANTPGEFNSIMPNPFFAGDHDVVIQKNASTDANIICKMQNVKFGLTLSPDFTTTFASYSLTITSGTIIHDLTEKTKGNFEPVYFKMNDNISVINLKVIATTFEGVHVDYDVPLTKGNAEGGGSNSFFEAGDALNVTLMPTLEVDPEDPEPEISGVGVKVTVAFTFASTEETIIIEIAGEESNNPETPGEGDGEGMKPTMACAYFTKTYTVGEDGAELDVLINAPEGIKNMNLRIRSSNEDFNETIATMGLTDCDMANLDEETRNILDEIGFIAKDTEIKNQTSFTFSIGSLVNGMLYLFTGEHRFSIEVVDNKGNTTGFKTITVIVKE